MDTTSSQLSDPASLRSLFAHNLNRLYFGKRYLDQHLSHLINLASFKTLGLALQELAEDVKKQITRLEEIYSKAELTPSDEECIPIEAMFKDTFVLERKGIGRELLGDMDIMLYMQLIEHINITAYRMLRILAQALNYFAVDQLLMESFDESVDNDRLFLIITNEYLQQKETSSI
jgi:ferritin-like metal-binding protein YciE